ncbi:uncharacterized protein EV420DRAFT_1642578 [Desarmillaria tabescens]|uniref:Uncharacterized protein n=1 Tax=Armillaria tabescens TaxID=1929756 RepID=A0AA39KCW8_ARMTA|nr:uncharacterized protein EV420DRAFT_1642578 [Desarmillaria tabescens]KAK0458857.1 hypothetical protein EV420DRAFT_1642578 [Desarmillaria tabescens]
MLVRDEPDPNLIVDGRRNHRRPQRYGESTSLPPPSSSRKHGPDNLNPSGDNEHTAVPSVPRQSKCVCTNDETLEECDEPEVPEKQAVRVRA